MRTRVSTPFIITCSSINCFERSRVAVADRGSRTDARAHGRTVAARRYEPVLPSTEGWPALMSIAKMDARINLCLARLPVECECHGSFGHGCRSSVVQASFSARRISTPARWRR